MGFHGVAAERMEGFRICLDDGVDKHNKREMVASEMTFHKVLLVCFFILVFEVAC